MTDYDALVKDLAALSDGVHYEVTLLSNTAALLYDTLPQLNWCGFYLLRDGKLILGPFQGKIACTEIAIGRGVCGTAAAKRETVRVENVHTFPGHIACDGASNSEIVVPIAVKGRLFGVLDLDSPEFARFSREDQSGLERIVQALESQLEKAVL